MGYDDKFQFKIMQPCGGDSRTLMAPKVSESYRLTAGAVAGRNSKTPIYIMHGGPSPAFLSTSVVDYIFYGISKVRAAMNEVPIRTIRNKLKEVGACAT